MADGTTTQTRERNGKTTGQQEKGVDLVSDNVAADARSRVDAELDLTEATSQIRLAEQEFEKHNWSGALAYYDAALIGLNQAAKVLAPEETKDLLYSGYFGKGLCHAELKQYAPSVDAFQKVLVISPSDPHALFNLALGYIDLCENKKAENALVQHLKHCTSDAQALPAVRELAKLMVANNGVENALSIGERYQKDMPPESALMLKSQLALHLGDYFYAEAQKNKSTTERRSIASLAVGQYSAAIQGLTKTGEETREAMEFKLGLAHLSAGNNDDALAVFLSCENSQNEGRRIAGRKNSALALLELKRFEAAFDLCEKLIRENPPTSWTLSVLKLAGHAADNAPADCKTDLLKRHVELAKEIKAQLRQ